MRRYLDNIYYMSLLLKNHVAADKTGDWERRLMIVEKLIPILEQRGSINYLRYASFYLEMMPKLPEQIFEIYEQFLKVTFVVKAKMNEWEPIFIMILSVISSHSER